MQLLWYDDAPTGTKLLLVDTSVRVMWLVPKEPLYPQARRLQEYMVEHDVLPLVPAHSLFEEVSAFTGSVRGKYQWPRDTPPARNPGGREKIVTMNIDAPFISKYLKPDLPFLRGGDLIFYVVAVTDGVPLVTEDGDLHEATRKAGGTVYRIAEYLEAAGIKPPPPYGKPKAGQRNRS